MPLYEYQCETCGRFELIRKFSDPPLTQCPTCERPVQKLLSAPAIQFKGTGWYITDYARKSGEAKSGKDAAATEATASKDTGAKDSGGSQAAASKDKGSGGGTKTE